MGLLSTFRYALVIGWSLAAHAALATTADATTAPISCEPGAAPSLRCARSSSITFDKANQYRVVWHQAGHIYIQAFTDGQPASAPVRVTREPEPVDDRGEDRPKIATGPQGGIYVTWTRKLSRPFTGHIRFSRSLDGGRTFMPPIRVNDDNAQIGHRFAAMQVNPQGRIFIAWVDKRDREAADARDTAFRGASLYYAVSEDRGASFSPSRRLARHSCECCRLAMTLDRQGLPVLFYRHVFAGQIRDHALLRFDAALSPLAPGRVTHDDWHIEGCPHHGPAIARSADTLHRVWFTAGTQRQGLFYARQSSDATSAPMAIGAPGAEHATVAADDLHVALAWRSLDGDDSVIRVRQSFDGGRQWQPARVLLRTQGPSDHPQLVTGDQGIYLSWQTKYEGHRLQPLPEARP